MYKHNAKQLLLPHEFFMPFEGQLNSENRWCKLAAMIPWEIAEERYIESLGNPNAGQQAYPVRMALGTLIIQNKKNLSDRETVAEITENPYLQYFIGLPAFVQEPPFDASLLVHFRKRVGKDIINELNELLFLEDEQNVQSDDDDPQAGTTEGGEDTSSKAPENKGNLILDATCIPVDIQYPTDSRLLNDAREALEEIIDVLHEPHVGRYKKPRTYRQRARKQYLRFERKRKHSKREIHKTNGQQLRYVGRNLRIIAEQVQKSPLTLLDGRQYRNLLVVQELYRQQLEMYQEKKHSVPDRIVSLHMPFVRPIVRGKKNASVEFGPKLAVSIVDGFTFMEKLSFDAFNEGITLQDSLERFKDRHGHYPAVVYADKIYRNRDNLRFCKKRNIRLSGPPLGRPSKDPKVLKEQRKQEREDTKIRNGVEGKFGEGKRFYGLGLVMTRLQDTCETVIAMQLLVLNLERKLRILLVHFFSWLFSSQNWVLCC
jgi:IS5 family transposase